MKACNEEAEEERKVTTGNEFNNTGNGEQNVAQGDQPIGKE